MFLQTADETQVRSLTDPWALTGTLGFDPEILLDTILLKAGEMAPLYNNIATFYRMNRAWWRKWEPTFQKWWEVIDDEYTPLWDRNGFETIDDHTTETGTLDTTTSGREVIDDDTTKHSATHEVTDDDTTSSITNREVVDADGTKNSTNTQVTDDDKTTTISSTEVMDDDTTNHNSITTSSTTNSTENTNENLYVSAFDSGYDGQGNPIYQPKSHETIAKTTNTTTSGTTTENGSGTDDRTTTLNGTTTEGEDKTVTDTYRETTTEDKTTNTTGSTTGTDDKTVDTTYNETGTDDRTTTTSGTVDTDTSGTKDLQHALHSWGNWGISQTSQKLLESEITVRYKNNLYEHMSDMFIDEMCVRVYM